MSDNIRAFIAIDLPDYVLRGIGGIQAGLKQSGVKVKWVRKESVHLTLKFLGDIPAHRVGEIGAAVHEAVKDVRPFTLEGKGVGVFPDFRRPRVIWAGISGELDTLKDLCQRLEEALVKIGFPKEKRPFQAHLTVGRIKGGINKQILRAALEEQKEFVTDPFTVASVILYQSVLQPQGAIYTKLVEAELTDP